MHRFFIDVAGERLEAARIEAERKAPTVVFLHEGLGSITSWFDFPQELCARLQAPGLIYARRGYGNSAGRDAPCRPDYLHREAWEVLPAVLDALQIKQPFLLGHSDGGSIALLHAARFDPGAIAVLAPHVFIEDVTLAGIRAARRAWNEGKLRAALARHHADPGGVFFGWNDCWLSAEFRDWNIEAQLPSIRCPVLAIQGFSDQYGTMEQLDRISRGLKVPHELLKLEHCGHAPQRDQPEAVCAAVERLYRSCST